jgi:hypothetical protein
MEGRKIDEAVGFSQEGLHSIKVKNLKSMVVKEELCKAYNKFIWIYIRLIPIHLGFGSQFVSWVMNCITYVPFSILINGATCPFIRPKGGIIQGFPLFPLIFLLVVEGLSRLLKEAIGNE